MKKTIFMLSLLATFASCEPKKADTSVTTVIVPPPPPVTPKIDSVAAVILKGDTLCFQHTFKKDVSVVKLILAGDKASGDYHWHPHEKDGGHGTFKGKKTGNIVNGDWTYMIEGATQTQEITFKLEGDKLMMGEGELTEKGAKLVYKNPAKLKYTDVFKKVNCATMKID